jgi:hypothetical protein
LDVGVRSGLGSLDSCPEIDLGAELGAEIRMGSGMMGLDTGSLGSEMGSALGLGTILDARTGAGFWMILGAVSDLGSSGSCPGIGLGTEPEFGVGVRY